jgi:Putative protein-S-isoprenylcysteine methyltransferase
MNAKLIIIIFVSYLYGFFEIYLSVRQKRRGNIAQRGDKGSIWLIIALITIGYMLSFGIAATTIGRIYCWNAFFFAGSLLIVLGLVVRITSIRILNRQFTYTVAKIENHELIERGLYKRIRHPGYLGQLIIFLGISTALSNWLSIVLMIGPVLLGYLYRMRIEERFMIEQFGEQYRDYQKRTKRLIPMIY